MEFNAEYKAMINFLQIDVRNYYEYISRKESSIMSV